MSCLTSMLPCGLKNFFPLVFFSLRLSELSTGPSKPECDKSNLAIMSKTRTFCRIVT